MSYFLIMVAPLLVVGLAVFSLFLWGAIGKEKYK